MSVQTEILPVPQTNSYRPFSDCLAGRNAFYNAPDYYESTQKDLPSKKLHDKAKHFTIRKMSCRGCDIREGLFFDKDILHIFF